MPQDPQQQEKVKDIPSTPDKLRQMPIKEFGGVKGPEPTRYGDWEKKGRCVDF